MDKIEFEWLESNLGRALTEDEQKYVEWVNGWGVEGIRTFVGLIDQAHRFGYISGEKA